MKSYCRVLVGGGSYERGTLAGQAWSEEGAGPILMCCEESGRIQRAGRVRRLFAARPARVLQGYLAHKKLHLPRRLQQDYAFDPTAVLGGGRFLMSKIPLYTPAFSAIADARRGGTPYPLSAQGASAGRSGVPRT